MGPHRACAPRELLAPGQDCLAPRSVRYVAAYIAAAYIATAYIAAAYMALRVA